VDKAEDRQYLDRIGQCAAGGCQDVDAQATNDGGLAAEPVGYRSMHQLTNSNTEHEHREGKLNRFAVAAERAAPRRLQGQLPSRSTPSSAPKAPPVPHYRTFFQSAVSSRGRR